MHSPEIRVRLLGEFDLRSHETPIPLLESPRVRSLLAYLLLHRDAPQPRQRIAFLLWPDSTEAQARTNLRHVLHTLRRALRDLSSYLEVTPQTLRWRADDRVWLDVAAFDERVARADSDPSEAAIDELRIAVDLYGGDLLPDCYDEWLDEERNRLRVKYSGALERLAALLESHGEHASAISYAERLLRCDSLREDTYRQLMRLHDARGDRARALRVYHACAATLERELGVSPSAATREAYQALLPVEREAAAQSCQERPSGSPLIGRSQAWDRLTDVWRGSESGRAQLLLLTGEAGIGKTRLLEELRTWCAQRGAFVAEARSYQAEGSLAFGSIAQWLRSEALRERLARLEQVHAAELARLLPELSADIPGLLPPPAPTESEQRHRLFVALARAIRAVPGPLLVLADDLQWCDEESLQFMHYLLRVEPYAPILMAGAARLEELDEPSRLRDLIVALHARECVTEIELARLNRDETGLLASHLRGSPLGEADAQALYRETEGNPLFVVETVRAGWKHRGDTFASLSRRVHASIEARLSRLSSAARDLAGLAATVGREFTIDTVTHASDADEETLMRALDELWRSRIVREQGGDAYDFSHDKIRQVAYQALSPVRRRQNHVRIASALKQLYAHAISQVGGQIAAHYDEAGTWAEAIQWYESAADAALRLHANGEALRLLTRARQLLRKLPDSPPRQARELALVDALIAPTSVLEGWASPRLHEAHERGLELSRLLGVEPAPQLLRSLAIGSFARDDFAAAQAYGARLSARAHDDRDDMLFVESEYVQGIAAFWQGKFGAARQHFERAVDRYRPEGRPAHLLRFGLDPQVICLSRLANTLWFMGDVAAAQRARTAALVLADDIGHAPSRAIALVFAALLAVETGEIRELEGYVGALERRKVEHNAPQIRNAARVLRSYAEVLHGKRDLSRLMRAVQDPLLAGHAPGMRAVQARLLLAASEVINDPAAGIVAAERALQAVGSARLWDAEAHRVRARYRSAFGDAAPEVEAQLERALKIAREQGARMLELKAASTLLETRTLRGDADGTAAAQQLVSALTHALAAGVSPSASPVDRAVIGGR